MLLTIISVLAAGILIIAGLLLVWSHPGKPKPFLDQNGSPLEGSLSEKVFVEVNGMQQGMFIRSRNVNNPILLYLHGGLPDYFLTRKFPTGLEDHFTIVWWEQRGAGLSYRPDMPRETLTLEQMISDTVAVTNYLRRRFGKDKIYLMGHSGGTFVGIQAAARAPELYHAYIGVAQMSNQLRSEIIAFDYMLDQFRKQGNTDMVRKLEAAPVTVLNGTPHEYLLLRDVAMHSLGIGTMREMRSVGTGIFLESFQFPEYTLPEKINLWRGKVASGVSSLWDTILRTDLSEELSELSIPVYFLHGIYDYTCSYTEAKTYFERLKAPIKGFYTFEQSAHSPLFEEPEKTQKILLEDVLKGANALADTK